MFTVVLPIHEFGHGLRNSVSRAIQSVPENIPIVIVTAPGMEEEMKEIATANRGGAPFVVVSNEDTAIVPMINRGIQEVKTDYFSILEADDSYTRIWFNAVERYIDEKPDVFGFLPITSVVDTEDKFLAFINEAPLGLNFSDQLGYITYKSLMEYMAFNLTGAVFNLADWESIGGLKKNIKLSFWYELMLRATKKGLSLLVVPRIGYNHTSGRDGCMFQYGENHYTQDEIDYWFNVALEEHEYHDDREVKPYTKD